MRREHRGFRFVAAVVLVLAAGCGGNVALGTGELDLSTMDQYSCGLGFWLGSPDQRVAVRFAAKNDVLMAGEFPQEVTLPDRAWNATVLSGKHLYSNWCDDFADFGDPEPVVREQWRITGGTITLHTPVPVDICPYEARATATGLEATGPDGTIIQLGDRDLVNDGWACIPG